MWVALAGDCKTENYIILLLLEQFLKHDAMYTTLLLDIYCN
jgi:hypothetical protein